MIGSPLIRWFGLSRIKQQCSADEQIETSFICVCFSVFCQLLSVISLLKPDT